MDRLNIITKDCFGALLQIRQADPGSLPAPEQVQQRLVLVPEQHRRTVVGARLTRPFGRSHCGPPSVTPDRCTSRAMRGNAQSPRPAAERPARPVPTPGDDHATR
jgi:hypothetical protein